VDARAGRVPVEEKLVAAQSERRHTCGRQTARAKGGLHTQKSKEDNESSHLTARMS
jgi:hypothetical protein